MSPRLVPKSNLPTDLDHIKGRKVARWLRESTDGQMDYFGPAAQTHLIDEAVHRHDLNARVGQEPCRRAQRHPRRQQRRTHARASSPAS